MGADRLLVIDEGTTSTRAMLFAADGICLGSDQKDLVQYYPRDGWVEHDAGQVWDHSLACARSMVTEAGGADHIAGLGITNQRETIVFWSRRTGHALGPAIVWQDRRGASLCEALKEQGHEPALQQGTGLLLDPYFSASKIARAMREWPQLAAAGDDLAIGTIDSWLIFNLTNGLHVCDATNASRTALMDLKTGQWSEELCTLFDVPRRALPEIVDCAGPIATTRPDLFGGAIMICGVAGDQQAAAIGQACLTPGATKATFGTGAFVLSHVGETIKTSGHRLLATLAWQIGGERAYALEGSMFVAGGLVKWLRDDLGLIAGSAETAEIAQSLRDSGGVFVVPALGGLGAPHWRPEARAAITGLSFSTGRDHIVRAALESMAHQTGDLMTAFAADGAPWQRLKIDGGMAANDWLAQDLADFLALEVERPAFVETTALGAAMLAGLGCGWFSSLADASSMRGALKHFTPAMSSQTRQQRSDGWRRALGAVLAS